MQVTESMQQARNAIRTGHLSEARRLLRELVHQDPQNYVAWLLLARATPSKNAALEYVKRAKSLQPDSPLVQSELLRYDSKGQVSGRTARRVPLVTYLLLGSALVVLVFLIVWAAPIGLNRVAALKDVGTNMVADTPPMIITPLPTRNQVVILAMEEPTLLPTPTIRPIPEVTVQPTAGSPEPTPAAPAAATDESIVEDAYPAEPLVKPTAIDEAVDVEPLETSVSEVDSNGIRPNGVGSTERWIDVNLNTQTLVAYEGDAPVFNSLISSGMWDTPTVTGQFRTQVKYETQDMNGYLLGYDYYIENVPYVMYFFEDYAIHGAYWHNSFGTPMSHGCVNMNPVDAGWLFNWAPVGTTVNIHN